MAPSRWRARIRNSAALPGSLAVIGLLAACGARTTTLSPQAGSSPPAVSAAAGALEPAAATERPQLFAAGVELPAGPGRELLLTACLDCHELGSLRLFKAFYGREDWRTLLLTMVDHGAEIDTTEVEMLADYLALHFGPGSP